MAKLPQWLIDDLAERLDILRSEVPDRIQFMSKYEILNEWLEWEGVSGFTTKILCIVELCDKLGRK